jgi:hypothetical protein
MLRRRQQDSRPQRRARSAANDEDEAVEDEEWENDDSEEEEQDENESLRARPARSARRSQRVASNQAARAEEIAARTSAARTRPERARVVVTLQSMADNEGENNAAEGEISDEELEARLREYEHTRAEHRVEHMQRLLLTTHQPLQSALSAEVVAARGLRSLLCPIGQQPFVDPVIAADGHTYERKFIVRWFKHSKKSPMTGVSMSNLTLYTNLTVRALMAEVHQLLSTGTGAEEAPAGNAEAVGGVPTPRADELAQQPPPDAVRESDGRMDRMRLREARLARFGA